MATGESFAPELEALIGQQVVVDSKGPFLYIGTLSKVNPNTLLLTNVDVHNTGDSPTTNERYLINALKDGVRVNRQTAYVLSEDIVSVSPLSAVIPY